MYWNYKSIEELQGFLRLHIPKRITTLKSINKSEIVKSDTVEIDERIELNDLGLLDYIDISESRFEDAT